MADDPTIQWRQENRFGILIDEDADAWHSGHVNDVVKLDEANEVVVIGTETGGVWVTVDGSNPLQLSDSWDNPDVKGLAIGPDRSRHLFAGCTYVYSGDPAGSAPVIMETDNASPAPLLNWNPVTPALPATAGRVTRIVVIRNLRRIVVTCAKIQAADTGGIFWATIPPSRFSSADPPRAPYQWKQANIHGDPVKGGFWDIAIASTRNETSRPNLEDRRTITMVAGGYGGGLFVGQWDDAGELVFTRPSIAFDDGADATAMFFQNCGTTSVSSCEGFPATLYAASAWPDGRLNSVLRSKNGGRNWTFCGARMANGSGPLDLLIAHTGDQGRKWNNCIAAHPMNPGMAALGWQSGPFLTRDGGAEWLLIEDDLHLHADQHALLFAKDTPDSIGNLYVGSDGGVARVNLDDFLGLTGQPFRSNYNRSLPTLQCYSTLIRQFYGTMGASATQSGLVATGLQDNGNVFCAFEPGGDPWRHADGGDGGWNAFPTGGAYLHNIKGEPVQASAPDAGGVVVTNVIPVAIPAPGNPDGLRGPVGETVMQPRFRNASGELLIALASKANTIYGLFGDGSAGHSFHWDLLGSIPANEVIYALASFQGDRVFAGTSGGKMYSLDSATGTVVEQPVVLPKPSPKTHMQGGSITRIAGFNDSDMFAVLLAASEENDESPGAVGGIFGLIAAPLVQTYVIGRDGDSWNNILGAGLPNEYLYGMVAVAAPHTRVEHGLLVSTDGAVYISRDNGQNWQRATTGLPKHPHCADLRFTMKDAEHGTIYLSTYGRSVWTAALGAPV